MHRKVSFVQKYNKTDAHFLESGKKPENYKTYIKINNTVIYLLLIIIILSFIRNISYVMFSLCFSGSQYKNILQKTLHL